MEQLPNAWGYDPEKIALLMEGLFQTSICRLRMSALHIRQQFQQIRPPLHIFPIHAFYDSGSMKNPSRLQLLVTTRTPILLKCASALCTFRGDMTKMILVGSGKYHRVGPHTIMSLILSWRASNFPPALESSVYHSCVTWVCTARSSWMSERTPMP